MSFPRVRTRKELRQIITDWRQAGLRIGFVPTMGALHEGHLSLVKTALKTCDRVVASIFVNPAQFSPEEDFNVYPRSEEEDCRKLAEIGCHLAYCPDVLEMYPTGSTTSVRVDGLSDLLDGKPRPHFFYGVATIVARLFIHVQPDLAVFGEKDYQQLQIIRRMVTDLGFDIEIIGGETQRAPDGLAFSSRNSYLKPAERRNVGGLFAALHRARCRIEAGASIAHTVEEAHAHLLSCGFSKIDYIIVVQPETLTPLKTPVSVKDKTARLLGAAWYGKTRLIDNVAIHWDQVYD